MWRYKTIIGFITLLIALGLLASGEAEAAGPLPAAPWLPPAQANYPPDPTSDLAWSGGFSGVADIQASFNAARTAENTQLGLTIPMLTLPSQADWDAMSEPQRALWLINRERIDRGVAPLDGLEANVSGVAQTYADYLLAHDAFSHTADGRDPFQRMNANPAIGACRDFLNIGENLSYFATSASAIPLTLEQSVYGWMYDDSECCQWGHRHTILWNLYTENGGSPASEGFLGIGRAKGGPYQNMNYAEITVMNVFDPCSAWNYNPASAYTISGRVTDAQGTGLPGVAVSAGGAGSVETGSDGSYIFANLAPGSYTLTPSLAGYTFTPPSRSVTLTSADAPGQDFVAVPPEESTQASLYLPVMLHPRTAGTRATPNSGLWKGVSLFNGQPGDPSQSITTQYEFYVSADQKSLVYFNMSFTANGCTNVYQFAYTKPTPIENGRFIIDKEPDHKTGKNGYYFQGTFQTPDTAAGFAQLIKFEVEGCGMAQGEGKWAASRTP